MWMFTREIMQHPGMCTRNDAKNSIHTNLIEEDMHCSTWASACKGGWNIKFEVWSQVCGK
jgi:hypothetical protein